MAVIGRDGETPIWLNNKLGSTDDLWSGNTICSQLSKGKLLSIIECFHCLQSHVKVKLLLSFIHIPKRNIEEWKEELTELCHMALNDVDPWVSMIGDILSTYPQTGQFNSNLNDVHQITHDIIVDLRKIVRKSHDAGMLPLECVYLSRNAMVAITGPQIQPVKHFTLKRKPRSAMLRAEVLQRSTDAANQLKRNVGSVPVKMRSFAKKMDDSTPLKGIPNQVVGSGGFLSKTNSLLGSNRNQQHNPSKEGGIKFLDINEQPICAKEAKRRKKIECENEKTKKDAIVTEIVAPPMPDYAAALLSSPPFNDVGSVTSAPMFDLPALSPLPQPLCITLNPTSANTIPSAPSSSSISFTLLPGSIGTGLIKNESVGNQQPIASIQQVNLSQAPRLISLPANMNLQLQSNLPTQSSINSIPQTPNIRTIQLPQRFQLQQNFRIQNIPQVQNMQNIQQLNSLQQLNNVQQLKNIQQLDNVQLNIVQKLGTLQQLSNLQQLGNVQQLNNLQQNNIQQLRNPLLSGQRIDLPQNISVPQIRFAQSNIIAVQQPTANIVGIRVQQVRQLQPNSPMLSPGQQFSIVPSQQQQQQQKGNNNGDIQQKKGLSLTKDQIIEVQEMFKNFPNITRAEKALILGFMAGSRDNPCPGQGQILNIRLGETSESVKQQDGSFRPMLVESFLSLNYDTGDLKHIRKARQRDPEAD